MSSGGERGAGIVLRLSDYSEASQVATVLLREHGLARLLGKGLRRGTRQRVAVGLDLLEVGECGFRRPRGDAALGTLTDWRQLTLYPGLRASLAGVRAGLYAAEITPAVLVEYDPHPAIFDALVRLLDGLEAGPPAAEELIRQLAGYQAAVLRAIGYAPNLRSCQECGRPRAARGPHFFLSQAGGLICAGCAGRLPRVRRLPGRLFAADAASAAREWFELLDDHLAELVGRASRGRRPLLAALGRRDPPARTVGGEGPILPT